MGRPPHRRPRRTPRRSRRSPSGVAHLARLFDVAPEVVAHDLHPEYLSTAYAERLDGVELVGVQHHHAHLAACLAEHGETGPARSARSSTARATATDGTVWGGEILVGDLRGFERAGHLRPVRLPGGDARGPRALADGVRVAAGGARRRADAAGGAGGPVDAARWHDGRAARARPAFASPRDDERGRLFDAVAALCGVPAARDLRGAGGGRARGAAATRPSAAPTRCRSSSARRSCSTRARRSRGRARRRRRAWRAAVVAARFHRGLAARRPRARARCAAGARAARHRRPVRRRVPEPAAARATTAALLRGARAARARPASACRPTTAASPSARPRSRRRRSAG